MKNKEITEVEEFNKIDYEMIQERLDAEYIAYLVIQNSINAPLLQKKDIVALRKADFYEESNIVFYKIENYYFLRRIIKKEEEFCYVCGDGEYEVRIIPYKSIVAKAISRERDVKRLSLILKSKNKIITKTVMKKGRLLLKRNAFFEDETTITQNYDIALKNTEETKVEPIKIEYDHEYAKKIEKELIGFLSPEERLRQFEENNQ